ncbi:MAG: long-chain-fatty-acid--CoA ligase [Pseudomonadota bacterium]
MSYKNIRELLEYRASLTPDDVFMAFYGEYITFRDLYERVGRLANALLKLGVKKGDIVNVHLFNSPEHFVSCMAAFVIGAVACPINVQFTPAELRYQVNDSGGVVLITESALAELSGSIRQELNTVRQVIEIGDEAHSGNLRYSDLTAGEPSELPPAEIHPDDNLVIIYTSGTTGQAKGALLTHGNFVYMIGTVNKILFHPLEQDQKLVMLIVMPMFHVNPLMHNLLALERGDKVVLMRKFSVREFGPTVAQEHPSYFFGVPKMYKVLLEARDTVQKYDLGSLEFGACGAAPMPAETIVEFEKVFGFELLEGYGLTEATFASTIHRRGGRKKIGSVGTALEGQEVRIMDPGGQLLGPGEIGEIVIRGPSLMKGYFGQEEETRKVLRDGWLHTGDIGRMDEEGFFFIVDREKDMIIKGGENIYPKEIEDVISEIPGVHDVGVVGVPDRISGEEVKAFIVPRIGSKLTAEEVVEHCKSRLAVFKVPKEVEFVLGIPASAIGKTLKRQLRQGEGLVRMDEEVEAIPLSMVWSAMAGRFKPEKAGDWKAKVAYEIYGRTSGAATFVIDSGKIEVKEDRDPSATAVVKMTDVALMRIIQGKMDMLTGINSGLIQVEGNEADLTLFGEALA